MIKPSESVKRRKRSRGETLCQIEQRIVVAVEKQFQRRFGDKHLTSQHPHDAIKANLVPEGLVAQCVRRSLWEGWSESTSCNQNTFLLFRIEWISNRDGYHEGNVQGRYVVLQCAFAELLDKVPRPSLLEPERVVLEMLHVDAIMRFPAWMPTDVKKHLFRVGTN